MSVPHAIGNAISKAGLGNAHYFESVSNAKLDEIKKLLDAKDNKDKLEGMKRLIAMISKGRDASSLFPDVVKNVVCTSLEVKKLVYIYVTHYAEIEPDAALLSIATFQKDLKDQNPLIRAQALRVLSSIRLRVITPVVLVAIQKAATDSNPYVRKSAAHAVSKVYNLDPEQAPALVDIIQNLLKDTSTMVLGSALFAFNQVCPTRFDLLHGHYRKLCQMLADIDEWGQITALGLLTRYARTQFLHPDGPDGANANSPMPEKPFYDDEEEDPAKAFGSSQEMDPDHRLLLRSALPLLQSRNNGVVLAVGSLYFYLAPRAEAQKVGKALTRLLKAPREVQYIALANIATLASQRPEMFQPFVNEFFVSATEPSFTRSLKLEILTYIATPANIHKILKEFNTYVRREDKTFVTDTIQAIGRCASRLHEVNETCMHGLVQLLASSSPQVIAESIIVMKNLLLTPREDPADDTHNQIVIHLAHKLDSVTQPNARAALLWVVGEFAAKIPTLAPDVFRKMAITFAEENDAVKLQVINLGAKLHVLGHQEVTEILNHVLNVAKYDQNYDVRDRARVVRVMLFSAATLSAQAKRLVLTAKPLPTIVSPSEDRKRFTLGTLSHILNEAVNGYAPLPDFPLVAPDPAVRNVKIFGGPAAPMITGFGSGSPQAFAHNAVGRINAASTPVDLQSFYDDVDEEDEDEDEDEEDEDEDEEDEDEDEEEEEDEDEEDEEGDATASPTKPAVATAAAPLHSSAEDFFNDFGTTSTASAPAAISSLAGSPAPAPASPAPTPAPAPAVVSPLIPTAAEPGTQ